MKPFMFDIAPQLQGFKKDGWTRADVADAVLAHARKFGPERTAVSLQRVAGWKTFENIGPDKFGAVIAHLSHELTTRPYFADRSMAVLKYDPKSKGSPPRETH